MKLEREYTLIYSLKGALTLIKDNFIVVECGGVGYKCITCSSTQLFYKEFVGKEITVYTYMNVRQDAIDFFGFSCLSELECFKLLISVSGVGSKAALGILSQFSPGKVSEIISSGDSKILTSTPGIGSKTAQRIILELKDKIKSFSFYSQGFEGLETSITKNKEEAIKALGALGYSAAEVKPWISNLSEKLSVEEIIRIALKYVGKGV